MAATDSPALYRVIYSGAVLARLREMGREARERGDGPAFLVALEALRQRLIVYPQFGEELYDLVQGEGRVYVGTIRPISLRYGVREDLRTVFCGTLPRLLPMDKPAS